MGEALRAAGEGGAIRLLWLIDSLTAGGAEALTVPFARAAAAGAGVELEVVYLKSLGGNPFEAELRAAGVPVTGLGARNLRDLRAFRRLLRLLRERRVDLVHAHLAYATIWALLAGRLLRRPVVATLHVRPPRAPAWSREGIRRRLLVALANRWAARVVAVSEAVRRAWVEEAGLAPARAVVVHNGVDLDVAADRGGAEAARRDLGVPAGAPLVLTVSVLRPGKGIEVLLDALPAVLARQPGARFAVVGDGPARSELERRGAAAGARVAAALSWTGFRHDVPALLAAADLLVLPSLDDAFPTVLLEAMAAGLPVVATRAGGIPEIVEEGVTGILVPPGDPAPLADAVATLLADPDRRRRLGAAGRRRAEERFSTAAWLGRLERLYGEVVGVGAAGGAGGGGGVALKIAVVEPVAKGGLVHYAFELCRALARVGAEDGVEVTLVTGEDYELARLPAPFGVAPVLRLWDPKPEGAPELAGGTLRRGLRRAGRGLRHYREQARLLGFLRRLRPDVVQLGDVRFAGDLLPIAALRAVGFRLADVCHNVRRFHLGGAAAGTFGAGALGHLLYRRIYRCFDLVFVHWETNRRRFLASYDVPEARVRAIPMGNLLLFDELRDPAVTPSLLRGRLGIGPDEPVILAFGSLAPYKGIDLLVEALPRVLSALPEARLAVVGFPLAGFDLEALRRRARELDVAHALRVLPAYVPSGEVAAWMELAAVAAFPYREIFQSGVVQVATGFGTPVVASRAGAMPEVVRHGETGLLVPPGEVEPLAEALVRLLRDPALARRLGQAAAADARSRLAWDRVASEMLAAYRDLLTREARP